MYGLPKITRNEAISLILDSMRQKIEALGEFAGDSLAYYGIEINWTLDMTLIARSEREEKVSGSVLVGEEFKQNNGQVFPGEGDLPEPKKETVKVSGKAAKGKAPRKKEPVTA